MIKFIKVSYKNLMSVGQVPIEIDLDDPGSYLIIGRNGAGKSVLGEAITFGLYGRPYRNINKPQLINSINKRDMMVEVDFETRGKLYRVRRGMKPTVFEVYENGKLLNQDAASRDYQEDFEKKILRMNFRAWKQIVMLGSTAYVPFMELKTQHRREMIEDLLDSQIYSVMSKLNSKRAQEAKGRLDVIAVQVTATEDKIKLIKANIARFLQNTEGLVSTKQTRIEEYTAKYEEAETQALELTSNLSKLKEILEEKRNVVSEKRAKANQLGNTINDRHRTISKDLAFFKANSTCPTCAQTITEDYRCHTIESKEAILADLNAAIEQLQTRTDAIEKQSKEVKALREDVEQKQMAIVELNSTAKYARTTVANLQQEIIELESQKSDYQVDDDEVKKLNRELKRFKNEKVEILSTAELFKAASYLLKDSGIKAQIVAKYVPVINKFINKYLAAMDFFVQFELNENFEEVILSRFRDEFTYNSFSQGEKFRIDLALLLTWRAIAKLRNSCVTNLLFLDEIFDSSLDNAGIEEFMKLIDTLVAEGTTVMVVSHKGDLMQDKFSNVMKFDKVKNFTQLVDA